MQQAGGCDPTLREIVFFLASPVQWGAEPSARSAGRSEAEARVDGTREKRAIYHCNGA